MPPNNFPRVNNFTGQTTYQWLGSTPVVSPTLAPMQQLHGYGSSPPQLSLSAPAYGSYGGGLQSSLLSRRTLATAWDERRDGYGKKYWVDMATGQATYRDPYV